MDEASDLILSLRVFEEAALELAAEVGFSESEVATWIEDGTIDEA
jgi:hypothetical protein